MNGLNPPLFNLIFFIGHMGHRFLDNIMPMVHSSHDNLLMLVMLCKNTQFYSLTAVTTTWNIRVLVIRTISH